MIAMFVIVYVAMIWLVYVQLRIRPNPKNLAVFSVVGIVAVSAIVICWQYSAPTSQQLVATRYSIQIVPQVRGPITKIVAQPNQPLKKGQDVLFEIQRDTYEFAVNQNEAAVASAENAIKLNTAAIKVSDETIAQAKAQEEAAQAELSSKENANERSPGAVSELELTELRAKLAAAEAGVRKSQAAKEQANASLDVAQEELKRAQAGLDQAKFDLAQCTVYAPADGFVTNWQVREGAMAVPLPLAPMGTFIDTSQVNLVGIFSQNVLKNVQPGNKVEIALKSYPGQIFSGEVDAVISATGEGQFTTSGQLESASQIHSDGKFAVKIKIDDADLMTQLPMGTTGMATIYTDQGKPFQVISTVTVRIKAWMYYLLPF